jgi:hypothetical protein
MISFINDQKPERSASNPQARSGPPSEGQPSSSKLYLRSESENDRARRPSAHIRVVLNDRLQKEHR